LITVVIAITNSTYGLTVCHRSLLNRHMLFGRLMVSSLFAQVGAVVIAIVMAWNGAGYWSVVALNAAGGPLSLLVLLAMCPWLPSRPRRGTGARKMLGFGMTVTGSDLASYLGAQGDSLVIGKFLGAEALGYYGRAQKLLLKPLQQFRGPISAVVVPALCRLQEEPEKFQRFHRRSVAILAGVTFPLVVATLVMIDDLVLVLLGPRWTEVADIYRVLAPAALVACVGPVGSWVMQPLGLVRRQLRLSVLVNSLVVPAILLGLPWGTVGVAWALSICRVSLYGVVLVVAVRGTPVMLTRLLVAMGAPLVAASLAGVVVLGGYLVLPDGVGSLVRLSVGTTLFGASYLALLVVRPEGRAIIVDLWDYLRARFVARSRAPFVEGGADS
jgi:PST family polysaccharide transporter